MLSSGRFLECWKCNILVATQALVHCLICPHLPLGALVRRAYISGNALVPVLQLLLIVSVLVRLLLWYSYKESNVNIGFSQM